MYLTSWKEEPRRVEQWNETLTLNFTELSRSLSLLWTCIGKLYFLCIVLWLGDRFIFFGLLLTPEFKLDCDIDRFGVAPCPFTFPALADKDERFDERPLPAGEEALEGGREFAGDRVGVTHFAADASDEITTFGV